jgi:hypothetical protein
MSNENFAVAQTKEENSNNQADREFSEALDRIYEIYGNNLSAFYRDAIKSITVEKSSEHKRSA